jgi:hypothetical protein
LTAELAQDGDAGELVELPPSPAPMGLSECRVASRGAGAVPTGRSNAVTGWIVIGSARWLRAPCMDTQPTVISGPWIHLGQSSDPQPLGDSCGT